MSPGKIGICPGLEMANPRGLHFPCGWQPERGVSSREFLCLAGQSQPFPCVLRKPHEQRLFECTGSHEPCTDQPESIPPMMPSRSGPSPCRLAHSTGPLLSGRTPPPPRTREGPDGARCFHRRARVGWPHRMRPPRLPPVTYGLRTRKAANSVAALTPSSAIGTLTSLANCAGNRVIGVIRWRFRVSGSDKAKGNRTKQEAFCLTKLGCVLRCCRSTRRFGRAS